jgi:ankyrin repeat protein
MKKSMRIFIPLIVLLVGFSLCPASMADRQEGTAEAANQKLLRAARYGVLQAAESALREGAEINVQDMEYGLTPLIWASLRGHSEVVALLLDRGADSGARSKDGATALIAAAGGGHFRTVQQLLNRNAEIDARTDRGVTALMAAAGAGYLAVVKQLLDRGADISAHTAKGATALIWAVANNRPDTTRLLLERGSDVNVVYDGKVKALDIATQKGFVEIQDLLRRPWTRP